MARDGLFDARRGGLGRALVLHGVVLVAEDAASLRRELGEHLVKGALGINVRVVAF